MTYNCQYFQNHEFTCKCGCGLNLCGDGIKRVADNIRGHFGRPMKITSGTRCPTHNRRVGGVANSQHFQGKAIDFYIPGVSQAQILAYCSQLKVNRVIGYYEPIRNSSCVHVDVGPWR